MNSSLCSFLQGCAKNGSILKQTAFPPQRRKHPRVPNYRIHRQYARKHKRCWKNLCPAATASIAAARAARRAAFAERTHWPRLEGKSPGLERTGCADILLCFLCAAMRASWRRSFVAQEQFFKNFAAGPAGKFKQGHDCSPLLRQADCLPSAVDCGYNGIRAKRKQSTF